MPVHEFEAEITDIPPWWKRLFGAKPRTYRKRTSILVSINEPAEAHRTQVVDGVTYKRVWDAAPLAAKDMRKGDCTKEDFRRVTEKNGITVGQMWETSAEMAKEREEKHGRDEVTERYYENYEKEIGEKHHNVKIREANKKMEGYGIRIAHKP